MSSEFTTEPNRSGGIVEFPLTNGRTVVLATGPLEKGKMLCMESPLLCLSKINVIAIYAAFANLSKIDKTMLQRFPYNRARITRLYSENVDYLSAHRDEARQYPQLFYNLDVGVKLVAIIERHARQRPGSGVYDIPRMINFMQHSCVPNAVISWNSGRSRWAVYAIQDIADKGAVTVSLLNQTLPLEARTAALTERGIESCDCDACNKDHADFDDGEQDRVQIQALQDFLAAPSSVSWAAKMHNYANLIEILKQRPEFSEHLCDQ